MCKGIFVRVVGLKDKLFATFDKNKASVVMKCQNFILRLPESRSKVTGPAFKKTDPGEIADNEKSQKLTASFS